MHFHEQKLFIKLTCSGCSMRLCSTFSECKPVIAVLKKDNLA